MRIDLAEYAHERGFEEDSTLIRYIAERVSKRSDLGNVMPSALLAWMKRWPWFLMLDGLDEVTEPAVRKRLIERVTELVTNAEADDCDLFVVLTTRPIGYTENIAPTQFERIDLDYLEPHQAVRYGVLVTTVRFRNDLDRIEKVIRQLNNAAEDEALRNLLRTPLQVLIMTIIISAAGRLAPDRFSLFWGYYDTIFRRERDKQTSFNRILQEHGQQIQQLHERIGFELQARSEAGDRSNATLTHQELENFTWEVLHKAGFKPSGVDADLRSKIVAAATRRLVLIAPRGDEGYGFDVRSLQELMAAMHLTAGPLDVVTERLRTAAPSPHWRNTWVFAAGHVFSTPKTTSTRLWSNSWNRSMTAPTPDWATSSPSGRGWRSISSTTGWHALCPSGGTGSSPADYECYRSRYPPICLRSPAYCCVSLIPATSNVTRSQRGYGTRSAGRRPHDILRRSFRNWCAPSPRRSIRGRRPDGWPRFSNGRATARHLRHLTAGQTSTTK
jgi:hypothetical protein